MLKIGITGQPGFIGTHLYNTLGLSPEKFERIWFEDAYFQNSALLDRFVQECDVIVHLAAMNRHNDPDIIYQTNITLIQQLIGACERTKSRPHVLFSSSTQEVCDNLYGRSKKEGRKLLEKWAADNAAQFTGFVIPNVFGPFGNPYYNSVVATFCHQLTHNEPPRIEVDSEVKLIHVTQLVKDVIERINIIRRDHANKCVIEEVYVPPAVELKISTLLSLLNSYKTTYFDRGEFPNLDTEFKRDLFTTFLTYINHSTFFPFKLKTNVDQRGCFVETIRLNSGGQVSFSTTSPGVTRGNHFHTRKVERFAVIKGTARIDIRRIGTDHVLSFELNGTQPAFVDMPVWYTHNITNVGEDELYTIFWINEHFDSNDPDTYYEKAN